MKILAVLTLAFVAFAAVGVHAEEAPAERNLRKNGNNDLFVPKASSHLSDVIAQIKAQLGLAHSHKGMAMESAQGKKEKKISVVSSRNNFMLESKQETKQHSQ